MVFIQSLNKQKAIKSYTGNTTVLVYNCGRSNNTFMGKKLLIFGKNYYFKLNPNDTLLVKLLIVSLQQIMYFI